MSPFTSSLAAIAMIATPVFALAPGDSVKVDAIGKAEFIQGEAPAEWKDGHVYVLECWATWCGPCIAAIPHIDELYDTYHEKGLHVIGMNVWEDDKAAVTSFVKEKGDGMSYPVAYVGGEGAFVSDWLEAAEVRGIPHAFVVKEGKLLFSTHPAQLDETMIEGLLAGGDEEKAIVDKIRSAKENEAAITEQLEAFGEAQAAGDTEAMAEAMQQVEKIDADFMHLSRMKVDLAVAREDWDAAVSALKSIEEPQAALVSSSVIIQQFDSAEEPPEQLISVVRDILAETEIEDPAVHIMRARAESLLGNKEAAAKAAKTAAATPGQMPKDALEAFAASYEGDDPQTLEELSAAFQKAAGQ